MASSMQVKLGVLILVVAAVAVTGNGQLQTTTCDYELEVFTPVSGLASTCTGDDFSGTNAMITFGVSGTEAGSGWTKVVDSAGPPFNQGSTDKVIATDEACFDPCRLTLKVVDATGTQTKPDWYPQSVKITILKKVFFGPVLLFRGNVKGRAFSVNQWVKNGANAIEISRDECVA